MTYEFNLKIRPQPKQSFRMGRYGGYTDKKKVDYVRSLKYELIRQFQEQKGRILNGKLFIESLVYCFEPPKSLSNKKRLERIAGHHNDNIKLGDFMDNLNKPLLDAMNGIIYVDDSKIVENRGIGKKIYGEQDYISFKIGVIE